MAKISLKDSNPRYYAQIQAEQDQIKRQYAGQRIARLCPYCDHKVEVLYRGSHGAASALISSSFIPMRNWQKS